MHIAPSQLRQTTWRVVVLVAFAACAGAACVIGPKQDDPLEPTTMSDAGRGLDGADLSLDAGSGDTGVGALSDAGLTTPPDGASDAGPDGAGDGGSDAMPDAPALDAGADGANMDAAGGG